MFKNNSKINPDEIQERPNKPYADAIKDITKANQEEGTVPDKG